MSTCSITTHIAIQYKLNNFSVISNEFKMAILQQNIEVINFIILLVPNILFYCNFNPYELLLSPLRLNNNVFNTLNILVQFKSKKIKYINSNGQNIFHQIINFISDIKNASNDICLSFCTLFETVLHHKYIHQLFIQPDNSGKLPIEYMDFNGLSRCNFMFDIFPLRQYPNLPHLNQAYTEILLQTIMIKSSPEDLYITFLKGCPEFNLRNLSIVLSFIKVQYNKVIEHILSHNIKTLVISSSLIHSWILCCCTHNYVYTLDILLTFNKVFISNIPINTLDAYTVLKKHYVMTPDNLHILFMNAFPTQFDLCQIIVVDGYDIMNHIMSDEFMENNLIYYINLGFKIKNKGHTIFQRVKNINTYKYMYVNGYIPSMNDIIHLFNTSNANIAFDKSCILDLHNRLDIIGRVVAARDHNITDEQINPILNLLTHNFTSDELIQTQLNLSDTFHIFSDIIYNKMDINTKNILFGLYIFRQDFFVLEHMLQILPINLCMNNYVFRLIEMNIYLNEYYLTEYGLSDALLLLCQQPETEVRNKMVEKILSTEFDAKIVSKNDIIYDFLIHNLRGLTNGEQYVKIIQERQNNKEQRYKEQLIHHNKWIHNKKCTIKRGRTILYAERQANNLVKKLGHIPRGIYTESLPGIRTDNSSIHNLGSDNSNGDHQHRRMGFIKLLNNLADETVTLSPNVSSNLSKHNSRPIYGEVSERVISRHEFNGTTITPITLPHRSISHSLSQLPRIISPPSLRINMNQPTREQMNITSTHVGSRILSPPQPNIERRINIPLYRNNNLLNVSSPPIRNPGVILYPAKEITNQITFTKIVKCPTCRTKNNISPQTRIIKGLIDSCIGCDENKANILFDSCPHIVMCLTCIKKM